MARGRQGSLRPALLPAALATLGAAELALIQPERWGAGVLLELFACAVLVLRGRLPWWSPTTAAVAAASLPLVGGGLDVAATPVAIIIVSIYFVAVGNEVGRGLGAIAVMLVPLVLNLAFVETDPFDVTSVVFICALMVPPFVLGRLQRALRRQAEQLLAQQDAVRRDAVRGERDRIARDLHDVIAHSMSAMVVQTAAAQDLVRTDPAQAEQLLRNVAEAGRDALRETGRLLHVIRDEQDELGLEPTPGLRRLGDLVTHYRDSGLVVGLEVDDPLPVLSSGADVSAYRVVQEALTNALKYSADRAVDLSVRHDPGGLVIRASNRCAPGLQVPAHSSGLGLLGMRERLALVGGELSHRVTPEGHFDVVATIPAGGPA